MREFQLAWCFSPSSRVLLFFPSALFRSLDIEQMKKYKSCFDIWRNRILIKYQKLSSYVYRARFM